MARLNGIENSLSEKEQLEIELDVHIQVQEMPIGGTIDLDLRETEFAKVKNWVLLGMLEDGLLKSTGFTELKKVKDF